VCGAYNLVIKDILGVIYAPHKTYKKIANNPKYLAVAIIILLFVSLQSIYYYNYYSKVNYEQTLPPTNQLGAFTSLSVNSAYDLQIANKWIVTPGAVVTENYQDFINQTFYAPNSLQIMLPSGNSLSASLEQFGYTANCGPDGFTSLNMNIKQASPNSAPTSGTITLYSANSTSNYFSRDITSILTDNLGSWNNLTIPVGTSEWQITGSPDWTEITGLKLNITYPTSSGANILLQGIFFRGQYITQTSALGTGSFFGIAIYSIFMQVAFQWIIIVIVSYLLLKILKANNTTIWKPLIVTMGYTLIATVIASMLLIPSALTLPVINCPYDLPYTTITYSETIINSASQSSQIAYESIMASTATFSRLTSAINIVMYALQIIFVTFAVKAVSGCTYTKNSTQTTTNNETTIIETTNTNTTPTELSYIKSAIIAVITIVSTIILLALLAGLGIF
jgi:hypothetical protein